MKTEKKHKKDDGFRVPEAYFGNFENRLFEKIEADAALPETEGFRVPKSYFETFETRLSEKLQREKTPKVIPLSASRNLYYALAAAAALLVAFIAVKGFFHNPVETEAPEVGLADIETYIDNGYMALNSYDMAEVFEDETLEITSITEEPIAEEKLIDYLSENLDHYDDLITEN